jgi:hypothetical protein
MSARDDYPPKRYDQAQARQWELMCDEIDLLRAEIADGHTAIDAAFDRLEVWLSARGFSAAAILGYP